MGSVKAVGVGIIGLGNVGGGTLRLLHSNADRIRSKLGFPLKVVAACSRSVRTAPCEELALHPTAHRTHDWRKLVSRPDVDVVAELIGGKSPAAEILEAAFRAGKPAVTANKELLAERGPELWRRARGQGVTLGMEASVGGGIPVLRAVREGIAGDEIDALVGILNGTSNYILTEIENTGLPFQSILREAQQLGYAEADPRADVDGFDARSKLAIVAALAFGERVRPDQIPVAGIRRVKAIDFAYAARLGHTIRLLASARREPEGLRLAVRPALVEKDAILAGVTGSYNALWVHGRGGDTFYYGRGAGPEPTGVAVVSDLMEAARFLGSGQAAAPAFAHAALRPHQPVEPGSEERRFYIRFQVRDRPGILAELAALFARQRVSIEAVLQEPHRDKSRLPFVITLEPARRQAVDEALDEMRGCDFLVSQPLQMPIEPTLTSD